MAIPTQMAKNTTTNTNYRMSNRILISAAGLFLAGCLEISEQQAHTHIAGISHTVWTTNSELFVEFSPLVVGRQTSFAAHFSDMATFLPIETGKLTVSLVQGEKGIRNSVDAPSQPGIFRPVIQPDAAGAFQLWFEIETPMYKDKIVIENVVVYLNQQAAEEAHREAPPDPNTIAFLKEQAWKIDWAVSRARKDTVHDVIRAGGEILPSKGDETVLAATANGLVVLDATNARVGNAVNQGAPMFTIKSGGTDKNIEAEFKQAQANHAQTKSKYERKQKLYDMKAISKAELEEALLAFELARSTYDNIAGNYSAGGKSIAATTRGFVKQIHVASGQYVKVGEPLAVIAQNKKLTLRADVPQSEYSKLKSIGGANFRTEASGQVYSIGEFNGKILAYGKSVSKQQPFIPVHFEIDNKDELLPGAFIDLFIQTGTRGPALVIPVEALMEDQGSFSVFIQTEGESFEKRDVITGVSDGKKIEVVRGLREGEMVVTKGAFQVKMASMSSSVPAHGHAH